MKRAAPLALAAALAAGCAHAPAPSPLALGALPPLAEPAARLVLIGDAGVDADQPSVLDEAQAWIAARPVATSVVFLGDNYYPTRADERVARVFARQRAVAPGGDAWFVPGNHEWHDRGVSFSDDLERARIDAIVAGSSATWRPEIGTLGPAAIEPAHARFRVLAIDSEAWRSAAGRCALRAAACDDVRAAEARLAAALACATCPPAVVVAHHPLQTVGEHGGCGMSAMRRALEIGGQDLGTRAYEAYVASLRSALAAHPPLLFAAGHDHSLQFARDPALGAHLVSGAGAKRSAVCGAPGRAFSRAGFATLDFAGDGAAWLRVLALDDAGALQEVLRERLRP